MLRVIVKKDDRVLLDSIVHRVVSGQKRGSTSIRTFQKNVDGNNVVTGYAAGEWDTLEVIDSDGHSITVTQ